MDQPMWRRLLPYIAIGMADVFAIGFGMGVPVFAILLGFLVGWWLARRDDTTAVEPTRASLRRVLGWAGALTGVSVAVLAVVWGPQVGVALDPGIDALDWGIPLILYTSQASKVGWIVLMLLISPALQFMAVVAGAVAALAAPRR